MGRFRYIATAVVAVAAAFAFAAATGWGRGERTTHLTKRGRVDSDRLCTCGR
jgi:hypothetical protein